MIAKVHRRGRDPRGLARYLHGCGRRNEHRYKRGGKSFAGGVVIGGTVGVERTESGEWGRDFAAVIAQRDRVEKGVYHVSLSAAPGDRTLSDGEWRVIGERVMEGLGVVEDHPWVIVRHAADHVHIALSRVSFDGTSVAKLSHDYMAIESVMRAVERDHGLTQVLSPDRGRGRATRHERLTTGETARAIRTGELPPRTVIAERVRAARDASAGLGRACFEAELDAIGVAYRANEGKNGLVNGYSFRVGTDADGSPICIAASKVARDLGWKNLSAVLANGVSVEPVVARAAAAERITSTTAAWHADRARILGKALTMETIDDVGDDSVETAPPSQDSRTWLDQLRASQLEASQEITGRDDLKDGLDLDGGLGL